jgi:hypothetical protein
MLATKSVDKVSLNTRIDAEDQIIGSWEKRGKKRGKNKDPFFLSALCLTTYMFRPTQNDSKRHKHKSLIIAKIIMDRRNPFHYKPRRFRRDNEASLQEGSTAMGEYYR